MLSYSKDILTVNEHPPVFSAFGGMGANRAKIHSPTGESDRYLRLISNQGLKRSPPI